MSNFWNKIHNVLNTTSNIKEAQFVATYQTKLDQVDTSFSQLKNTARQVSSQAVSLTEMLTRSVELVEKRFDIVANSVKNIVMVKTVDNQWVAVNDFACQLLKIDRKKCIGKTNEQMLATYPHLSPLLKALYQGEQLVKSKREKNRITVTIDDEHLDVMIEIDLTLVPIETSDHVGQELIILGKKTKKRRKVNQQNG